MKLIFLVHALFVLTVVPISAAWAQDTGIFPLELPTENSQQNDDVLEKLLDGEYSPEIYRVNDGDDDEKRLLKQQINCLYAECNSLQFRAGNGIESDDFLLDALRRLGDAKLEFHVDPEEQRKILTEQLENAKKLESSIAKRVSMGMVRSDGAYKATYFRIKVELALLRLEKAQAEISTKKLSLNNGKNGHHETVNRSRNKSRVRFAHQCLLPTRLPLTFRSQAVATAFSCGGALNQSR